MHGHPPLRLALVIVALGIVGAGVWSVTGPASALPAAFPGGGDPAAPANDKVQLTVKITLLQLASEVRIGPVADLAGAGADRHETVFARGKAGERAALDPAAKPPYACTSTMAVPLPPEGIDIPFSITWTGPDVETAVRVEISDGLRTSERVFWTRTTGQFSDAITFGAPAAR